MLTQILPLELLAAGELACICDVAGSQELVHRLAEMGLREGVQVRMIQPGRPCIIAVANHRLSFRGEESAFIMVETGRKLHVAESA